MLRKRGARSALAVGCTLAAAAFGCATASAAERAFELVTPADNRAEIETNGGFTSPTGDLVVFASTGSLAGAEPNGPYPAMDSYTARRGVSGWTTEWTTDSTDEPGTYGSRTIFSTDDGMRQIMQTENSIDADDRFPHSMDPYLRVRAPDGTRTMTWLTPGVRTGLGARYAVATTSDLRTILVRTGASMVPEDVDGHTDLYLLTEGGVRLLTPGDSSFNEDPVELRGYRAVPGTLSSDGSYVYLVSTERLAPDDVDNVRDIYRWNASDGSYERISVSTRTRAPNTPAPATLLGASDDGDVICFTTARALVDGDDDIVGKDVYCYTRSTGTLDWASAADVPLYNTVPIDATALGMSADGSSVFFSTIAPLTAEDTDNGPSLYVRRGGVTSYVSPLDASDTTQPRRAASPDAGQRALQITADGRAAVFTTAAQAISATDRDAALDVYRWTVDKGLEHVSAGGASGDSMSGAEPSSRDLVMSRDEITGRVINEDASVVFFESRAALVPQDTDGGFIDVYEWREDGGIRLVSPEGDARYDALYMDNSADGSTVFFVTAEPVMPYDTNAVRDLYAARVGGGYPLPESPPDPCKGEACQGNVQAPPVLEPPATSGYDGPEDADEPEPVAARQRLLALTAKQRRALVRRGRVAVRVTVSEPGMVIVTASARIGRRTMRVARSSVTTRKKGTVRIPLALSKVARAQLRRQRRLRVTFTSMYSKTDESVRRAVMLRG